MENEEIGAPVSGPVASYLTIIRFLGLTFKLVDWHFGCLLKAFKNRVDLVESKDIATCLRGLQKNDLEGCSRPCCRRKS